MTSNLRQIKLFFLIVACVSVLCLLYAYNWNMSVYKLSSELSQVNFARIERTNTATRSTYNAILNEYFVSDQNVTIKFNNTMVNSEKRAETFRESMKDLHETLNDNTIADVDSANAIKIEEANTTRNENKNTAKHTDNARHIVDSTNETKTNEVTKIKAKYLDGNDKDTVKHTDEIDKINAPKESPHKELSVTDFGGISKAHHEKINVSLKNNNKEGLNRTVAKGNNIEVGNKSENSPNVRRGDEKVNTTSDGDELVDVKTPIHVLNSTAILSKPMKDNVTNMKLNADDREELQRVKDRWIVKAKKKQASVDSNPKPDDTPKPTRDMNAFQRVKNHLKQLGFIGNNPFALRPNIIGSHIEMLDGRGATSRPDMCESCFRNNFKKLITEPNFCEGEVDLLILITSSALHTENRDAIRNTWGKACNVKSSNIKCLFVFGNKNNDYDNDLLKQESKQYHDIAQFDFYDVYANLTYKTLSSIQWSHDFCPQAKYIMKTDDDMFVNIELLPIFLKGAPDKEFIGGMCWGPSSPHRDMNSKWYVSFVQYEHPLFPSMCSGTGYVMSRDVADGILRQSPNVPFFYLEDVYVAICVKKLKVKPLLLAGFKNTMVDFNACAYRNRYITVHGFSGSSLELCWKQVQECPLDDLTPSMVYSGFPV